jgi:hypothetical protein
MTSMETTLANADARAAERDWRNHRLWCPKCSTAVRSRRWSELCNTGQPVYEAHRDAQYQLAESRKLDRAPSPDQVPLF